MNELKKELKKDSHSKWAKIKQKAYKVGSYVLIYAATLGIPNFTQASERQTEKPNHPSIEYTHMPTRKIDYQVDTVFTYNPVVAYFMKNKQSITQNYYLHMDHNKIHETSLLAHEQKHRDNNLFDLPNTAMSLEQHYKALCHNEISANIVELLQLRQMYIDAPNQEERNKIVEAMRINFEFYANSLNSTDDKKIDPLSTSPKDFDKEMKFISNHIQKSWMENNIKHYNKTNKLVVEGVFYIHNYNTLKENNENYQKYLDTVYTIGGLNFSKYMDKDIDCYALNIKEAQELINKNAPRNKVLEKLNGKINNIISYDQNYTPETYTKYTGNPIYPKWSKNKRVSDIQYAELYDFSGSGLKQYRDYLNLLQQANSNKKSILKFNKRSQQRAKSNIKTAIKAIQSNDMSTI